MESNNPPPRHNLRKIDIKTTVEKPPVRAASNKDFSAWAESLGEEKDDEFILWKKEMIGEIQRQKTPVKAGLKQLPRPGYDSSGLKNKTQIKNEERKDSYRDCGLDLDRPLGELQELEKQVKTEEM